jgi:Bax protein
VSVEHPHVDANSKRSIAIGIAALGLAALVVAFAMIARWDGVDRGVREPAEARADVPPLQEVQPVSERKQRFFDFLRPVVEAENARIREERKRVLQLRGTLEAGGELSESDRSWLDGMARRYRVEMHDPLSQARRLSRKVDVIPPSLALAQAALESAWGTSRFAREANNLFGEWCFTAGCGVVPKRRPAKATYEVEAFPDVGASVRSYMHNLNSHPAYAPLREIRAQARAQGREPTGAALAGGLYNYAAIGHEYVDHIRNVIRRNDLGGA